LMSPTLFTGATDQAGSAPHDLGLGVPAGTTQTYSSVAIPSGCSSVVVVFSRDAVNPVSDEPAGNLIVFDLDGNGTDAERRHIYELPAKLRGLVVPSFPLASPALVAAKTLDENGKMRVAWLMEGGLAVVDIDQSQATGALPKDELFLTGLDASSTGNTRMAISNSGKFLLLLRQRSAKPEMRIFDLRVDERMHGLGGSGHMNGAALRAEACRVAGFLPEANKLTRDEMTEILRLERAPQPCAAD
jgi:hypothetical protein